MPWETHRALFDFWLDVFVLGVARLTKPILLPLKYFWIVGAKSSQALLEAYMINRAGSRTSNRF